MRRTDADDGLQLFLRNAANHRLLTAHEEKALGRRAQKGDTAARHELLMCNIRLVVSVAGHFRGRGMDFTDLIQTGIIGLNRATEKFDPERGYRFTTYATLWIKQAIQRGLVDAAPTIRLPPLVAERRIKARALRAEHEDWTEADIAEALDMELQQVIDALGAAEVVTSLDRELQDDDAMTLLDMMPDHFADDPQDVEDKPEGQRLRAALDTLDPKAKKYIELRFGLATGEPLTIEEAAKRMRVTRDVARKTEKAALASLREKLE